MPCLGSLLLVAAFAAWRSRPAAADHLAEDLGAFLQAARAANLAWAAAEQAFGSRAPRGAKVAPQWLADSLYSNTMGNMNLTDGVGWFAYDAPGQRYRFAAESRMELFSPSGTQYIDQNSRNTTGVLNQNMTVGKGDEGVCMPVKGDYFDIFSWTLDARYNGSKVVDGEPCDIWKNAKSIPSLIGKEQLTCFEACIAADGVPSEFTQAFYTIKVSQVMSHRLSNIRLGHPGEATFASSDACDNYPARPCEDRGVKTISVYRVWAPPEPVELRDRNTGDTMGDLSFSCTQASEGPYRSKLITHWSVEVSSAFGQYSPCNYDGHRNKCWGEPSMLRRVGRRSSQMVGNKPRGGQCTESADVGSQYSFPSEARCPEGTSPSADGCAWAAPRPVRTVQVACVLGHGLLEACAREFGHAPFARSIAVFEAAFASSDPSKGGCPDALSNGSAAIVV